MIENLKPATKYAFRVIAEGPAGQSVPSQVLVIKTEPQRPAGPPLNLSARPTSSTEILVSWSPPLVELRHGEIQGYNIGYKSSLSTQSNYNFSSILGDGESGTGEFLLSGLLKYTRYIIVVQAFNQVGPGPLSEPVTAQTLEDGMHILNGAKKYNSFFLISTFYSSESTTRGCSLYFINITVIANFMAATAITAY